MLRVSRNDIRELLLEEEGDSLKDLWNDLKECYNILTSTLAESISWLEPVLPLPPKKARMSAGILHGEEVRKS